MDSVDEQPRVKCRCRRQEKDSYDKTDNYYLSFSTTYSEVLEEQITPIVLYIEEQAKDQNEKHGASKYEYIILSQIPGQIALILLFLIR